MSTEAGIERFAFIQQLLLFIKQTPAMSRNEN
jgi:hypothetical protein